jgi:hypothetical protein
VLGWLRSRYVFRLFGSTRRAQAITAGLRAFTGEDMCVSYEV